MAGQITLEWMSVHPLWVGKRSAAEREDGVTCGRFGLWCAKRRWGRRAIVRYRREGAHQPSVAWWLDGPWCLRVAAVAPVSSNRIVAHSRTRTLTMVNIERLVRDPSFQVKPRAKNTEVEQDQYNITIKKAVHNKKEGKCTEMNYPAACWWSELNRPRTVVTSYWFVINSSLFKLIARASGWLGDSFI